MITVEMKIPPSTNDLWTPVRSGHAATQKSSIEYKNWQLSPFLSVHADKTLYTKRLKANILMNQNLRRDTDNYLKAAFDALQKKGLIKNDSQIRQYHFFESPKLSNAIIILEEIDFVQLYPAFKKWF